jgi:hypothetical protein
MDIQERLHVRLFKVRSILKALQIFILLAKKAKKQKPTKFNKKIFDIVQERQKGGERRTEGLPDALG